MFLSKLKFFGFLAFFFLSLASWGQENSSETSGENADIVYPLFQKTISLSYVSWTEFVELERGALKDKAFASFYGNSFAFEREYGRKRWRWALEGALITGQASAGGSQSVITYQAGNKSWVGAMATAKLVYKLTSPLSISLGPTLVYRQITWSDEGTGADVKSGAPANAGVLAELKMRVSPKLEVHQTFGTLALKAGAIWSVGLGFKF